MKTVINIVLAACAAVIGLGFGVFSIAKGVANEGTVNVQDNLAVVSDSSFAGDCLSTGCFVLGMEQGMELVESLDGVYAIFVDKDYKIYYSEGAEALVKKG